MEKQIVDKEDKKILNSMFWRSHLVFLGFNMAKMEANGFTLTMEPAIEQLYGKDKEARREAYERHQNFFNTHAVAFSFIAGLTYAMEKQHAKGLVPADAINNIKAALMGPTAGMFDSIFFNCIRVIVAGVCMGLMSAGNPIGIPLFILGYGVTQSIAKYVLLNMGYTYGTTFIDKVFQSGMMSVLTKAASVLGLMMVGAMTATTVGVPVNCNIDINGATVELGGIFDSIFPGLLSLVLLFVLMRLIKHRKQPIVLIFGILVIGLVGAFLGIF